MSSRTLLGKSALVTGATSGIGEVTAYALAAAGAHVLVVGRRSDLGNAVVRTIEQSGGKAKFFAVDMRSTEEINAMVECAVNEFGKLDIAFNNAGIFDRMNDFHIYSDESWDEMLAVNLTGVFRCMRAELASMITSGGGVIINNASTVSHRGSLRLMLRPSMACWVSRSRRRFNMCTRVFELMPCHLARPKRRCRLHLWPKG